MPVNPLKHARQWMAANLSMVQLGLVNGLTDARRWMDQRASMDGPTRVNGLNSTLPSCNGVKGYLVTGKGAYASKSIFLPAAGSSFYSFLMDFGATGSYWFSSTGWTEFDAWFLYFDSAEFTMPIEGDRDCLLQVRPVRRFAK